MNLSFKDPKEAVLAYLLPSFWTPQDCFRILAEGAAFWCHDGRESVIIRLSGPVDHAPGEHFAPLRLQVASLES